MTRVVEATVVLSGTKAAMIVAGRFRAVMNGRHLHGLIVMPVVRVPVAHRGVVAIDAGPPPGVIAGQEVRVLPTWSIVRRSSVE